MSGNKEESLPTDNDRQRETRRECRNCSRLEHQIGILKEVSTLRQTIVDQRDKEAKDLIGKLKFFEEAIDRERGLRQSLSRRVESAEQQCLELTENLHRNVESLGEMQSSYDNRIASLISNLETSDEQLVNCRKEFSTSQDKNDELYRQISDLDKLVNDNKNVVRKLEKQLKVTVDRNKVLSYQMSLLNNLFNETDLVLIDFDRIKAIGDIVRETHNLPEIEINITDEDRDRRPSIDLDNVIEKIDSDKNSGEIPGEESCYKSVDTVKGPQLVLSVSRTFIKLKDLILEKKALQKEIESLKTLNSKLETKVDKQERRLYCVTVELNKTWNLVSKLKVQHNKLHTNEAVLKYELQEKRKQLEKLKTDLSSSREKWLKVRQKNSESQLIWQNLRDEFALRKQESSQESAFSENMSSSSANEDEEGATVVLVEESEGQINEGYEPEGAYGITLIPDDEIVEEDYMDPLEEMVSDLVEEIEATAAEGDAEDEGIDDAATSSEESSSERVIRRANRLRMLEEECHLLHSKLLASTARSAALASKLATLHNHYSSRDSDPENSENYEQDSSRTGEASTSVDTADTEATVNQTRSDVYDTEMPSSENESQYGEIAVIINDSENNGSSVETETEAVHNAEIVLDIVPVPAVDYVESLPNSEIVLQPIVHEVDVTETEDNLPLRDSVQTPNLIITTHNPPVERMVQHQHDLDMENNNIYDDRQYAMQLQVQIDPEDEIGDSADLLSELDISREQSQSPLLLQLDTASGIDYVDVERDNEIENEQDNESEQDNYDEEGNHRESSSSSEGSFHGSPDPNYLGRLIIKQLPVRLEILKRENQALMKEAVEYKLEMQETERLLKQQVSKHKKSNEKLKNQIEKRNLVEFELREEIGHKEQTIEELHKEIQDAKIISESFKRKEDVINDFVKKVAEEKLKMESSKQDMKSTKSCKGCDKSFSLFRRKNYCSVCSHVFCKVCAPKRKSSYMSVSQTRLKMKQRICHSCEDRREQINALATEFTDTNF